jgi:hypothetical protein
MGFAYMPENVLRGSSGKQEAPAHGYIGASIDWGHRPPEAYLAASFKDSLALP